MFKKTLHYRKSWNKILCAAGLACLCVFSVLGQDPWLETGTQHFTFIFKAADQNSVRELAGFCEDVYKLVTDYFDSSPEHVRCIVYGEVDTANGVTWSGPPHHIKLYTTMPDSMLFGSTTSSWLRLLLTHEFTHYVHLLPEQSLSAYLSYVLGKGVRGFDTGAFLPGWMIEGITTNLETLYTDGGRGKSAEFLMYAKALLYEKKLFSEPQMQYSSSYPPWGSRIYLAGLLMVDYLMKTYKEDVFARIHKDYLGFPLFGPWGSITKITKKPMYLLYSAMVSDLQKRFANSFSIPAGALISPKRQTNFFMPAITDKGLIVYRDDPDKPSALILYNNKTKEEKVLCEPNLTDSGSFSADQSGNTVIFSMYESTDPLAEETPLSADLYLCKAPDYRIVKLTNQAHCWQPALSGDGTKLVAIQKKDSYSRLIAVDIQTGAIRILFDPQNTALLHPRFSPDGNRILVQLNNLGLTSIVSIPWTEAQTLDKSAVSTLVGPYSAALNHPLLIDENHLWYTADFNQSLQLYSCDLRTGTITKIAADPVGILCAAPWKKGILYSTLNAKGFCLRWIAADKILSEEFQKPEIQKDRQQPDYPQITAKEYISLPEFQFWLPIPALSILDVNDSSGEKTAKWGAGFYTYWTDLFQNFDLRTSLSYLPELQQPLLDVQLFQNWRYLQTLLYVNHSYGSQKSPLLQFKEEIYASLSVNVPFYFRYNGNDQSLCMGLTGIEFTRDYNSTENFSFLNLNSKPISAITDTFTFTLGCKYEYAMRPSLSQFYSPWAFVLSQTVQKSFGVLETNPWDFYTENQIGFTFPVLFHTSAHLHALTGYSPVPEELRKVQPRVFRLPLYSFMTLRTCFSLDYLLPLGRTDLPLPFCLHLDRIGLDLYVEKVLDWRIAGPSNAEFGLPNGFFPSAVFQPYYSFGAEFIFELGYLAYVNFPLGIGLHFIVPQIWSIEMRDWVNFMFSIRMAMPLGMEQHSGSLKQAARNFLLENFKPR